MSRLPPEAFRNERAIERSWYLSRQRGTNMDTESTADCLDRYCGFHGAAKWYSPEPTS